MRRGFPMGFLKSFLSTHKVSYFMGAESHREFRKHSTESRVNSGAAGFPPLETFPSQETLSFLEGFLEGVQ